MHNSWEENLTIGIGRFPRSSEIGEQFMGVKFLDKEGIFVRKETLRLEKIFEKSWDKGRLVSLKVE